jgi:hypothetical protein
MLINTAKVGFGDIEMPTMAVALILRAPGCRLGRRWQPTAGAKCKTGFGNLLVRTRLERIEQAGVRH